MRLVNSFLLDDEDFVSSKLQYRYISVTKLMENDVTEGVEQQASHLVVSLGK